MVTKKVIFPLMLLISACWLINWGTQDASVEGRKKQSINFYGTLTTHNGKKFSVENISIARLYKQIPAYETPENKKAKNKYTLSSNPKDGIVTRLDLSEIAAIATPHPDANWTYQEKEGSRKIQYMQVVVTSKDPKQTKNNYLIEVGRKLICDQVNEAGPIEMDVPLQSIKTLSIKGYKERIKSSDNSKKENHSARTA